MLQWRAKDAPTLLRAGKSGGGELGIDRGRGAQGGGGKRTRAKGLVHGAEIFAVKFEPFQIRIGRMPDHVGGAIVRGGNRFHAHGEVFGIIAAPIKTGSAAIPFVAAAAPKFYRLPASLK